MARSSQTNSEDLKVSTFDETREVSHIADRTYEIESRSRSLDRHVGWRAKFTRNADIAEQNVALMERQHVVISGKYPCGSVSVHPIVPRYIVSSPHALL